MRGNVLACRRRKGRCKQSTREVQAHSVECFLRLQIATPDPHRLSPLMPARDFAIPSQADHDLEMTKMDNGVKTSN